MTPSSSSGRDPTRTIDSLVSLLIRSSGITTICAVGAVCLFLLWVTKDLFLAAKTEESARFPAAVPADLRVLQTGCDEYRVLFWCLQDNGQLLLRRLDTGESLRSLSMLEEGEPVQPGFFTSSARHRDIVTVGDQSGRLRVYKIGFETSYHDFDSVPAELRELRGIGRWGDSVVQRTPTDQCRRQRAQATQICSLQICDQPLISVQFIEGMDGPLVAALDARGRVFLSHGESELDMTGDGEEKLVFDSVTQLPADPRIAAIPASSSQHPEPRFLALTNQGSQLLVIARNGLVTRFNLQLGDKPQLVEKYLGLLQREARPTAVARLLGESTVIIGDQQGGVYGMFLAAAPGTHVDNRKLVIAHEMQMQEPGSAVAITSSARQRMFVVSNNRGQVDAWHMTSHKHLLHLPAESGKPVEALCIAPKDNGLLAVSQDAVRSFDFDPRHPEVTFHSLFGKVWYEGYESPGRTWQSSSADDSAEPKMSLMPLVFGTLKATSYSMLFAIPLALLAALYTSEFMNKRLRPRVKFSIELMASLPSVVLGFLAALVIAPVLEGFVATAILSLFSVPFCLLLGAYLFQLSPMETLRNLTRFRLGFVLAGIGVGILVAVGLSDQINALLFAGDIRSWLNSQSGDGWTGWFLLALPLAALLVGLLQFFWLGRLFPARHSHLADAGQALARFLLSALATVLLGMLFASLCHSWLSALRGLPANDLREGFLVWGFDLSPFGSIDADDVPGFDQRNALVVGFIMGFAVIPIIYTIAEDALSRVPDHLRAASLAAGATIWQTSMRVVLPSAISGLFSAVIIGLGRAVGETMIVLMAAGNTPLMSMNVFNGFRTLSANIATELPEAVRDTSHYRVLFLAALVLFAMTFVINTLAETIRIHFRRKAAQL